MAYRALANDENDISDGPDHTFSTHTEYETQDDRNNDEKRIRI